MKERIWQVGFMLALFGTFLLGAAIGQSTGIPLSVRAQKFELTNQTGKVIGTLGVDSKGNATLVLCDKMGLPVCVLPSNLAAAIPASNSADLGLEVYGCRIAADIQIITPPQKYGGTWHTQENRGNYATGFVRNNSTRTYRYVRLYLNCYDRNGTQIDSTTVSTMNLVPGQVWQFKVPLGKSVLVTGFQVVDIRAG